MTRRVLFSVFLSGIGALAMQTLIIRESLVFYSGNELVAGLQLSGWLVWAGLGSFIFSRWRVHRSPLKEYAFLVVLLNALFLITIALFQIAPRLTSQSWGEMQSLGKIFWFSSLVLCPLCIVIGGLFPVAGRVLDPKKVYFWEASGSFAGGLLMSFVLIGRVPALGAMVIISSLLLVCALVIIAPRLTILALAPLVLLLKIDVLETNLRRMQMPGQNLIGLHESKYGFIAVTKTGDQLNFYSNGVYDFSFPDPYNSEEAVQYAMLCHEQPRKVLLIGGGYGNCISQVLMHADVRSLTYLELDPAMFIIGKTFLGQNLPATERLKVVFGDARHFIKKTRDKFDVVIVNLPDPVNGQINRFYTKEFFRETERVLDVHGLISVRLSSPADIISPLHAQYLKTVLNALRQTFAEVLVLPAAKITFIAGDRPLETNRAYGIADRLKDRIKQRDLALSYVNEHFLDFNLSPERIGYLNAVLSGTDARPNRDLYPACYFFSMALWLSRASRRFKDVMIDLSRLNFLFFFLPILLTVPFLRSRKMVYCSVFCLGAGAISLEIILIFLFQAFCGYLYGWIGAMLAAFMIGLAGGSYLGSSRYVFTNRPIKTMVLALCVFLIMIGLTIIIAGFQSMAFSVVFFLPLFGAGFVAGTYFPLAVDAAGKGKASIVYGVDMIGSACGAVLTTVVLIPVKGLIFALFFYFVLTLSAGLSLLTVRE